MRERWAAAVVLGDGETAFLRPIAPDDGPALRAFHERQSAESRYRRYFSPKPTLNDTEVRHFTEIDFRGRVALVLEPENPGKDYLGGLGSLAMVDYSTVLIALGAGVAAILSFETRAANAVGVAISVTTVPASAYLGVGIGVGEIGEAIGALLVLAVNVFLMILTATITLYLQRRFAPDSAAGKLARGPGRAG